MAKSRWSSRGRPTPRPPISRRSSDRPRSTAAPRSSLHVARAAGHGGDAEQRFNWTAEASGLALGRKYYYRVRGNGQMLAEGYFTTRQPRGRKIRFVAFGDNSYGDISDRAIAYHAYQQHPDFVMNCGDNVYESGSDDEYQRYFFPVYNADLAGPREGAPLLRSVPFYTVIANHDVQGKDEKGHEIADFSRTPDSLAFYTAMHLPLNGPRGAGAADADDGAADRRSIASRPAPAGAFRAWRTIRSITATRTSCASIRIATSIRTSRRCRRGSRRTSRPPTAIWKFVVFHHPPFNVGDEHYEVQHMRVLAPLFEAHGVDVVLSGHEHNYQRARPLKFVPAGPGQSADRGGKDRRVPGTFTIDRTFDGVKRHASRPASSTS